MRGRSGMLGRANVKALEEMGVGYVVGARLRGLSKSGQEMVLDANAYRPHRGGDGRSVAEFEHEGRRLIVSRSPKRAARDARKRDEMVKRLAEKVKRKGSLGEMALPRASSRFLRIAVNARLELEEEKIAAEKRWDGFAGVLTDNRDMEAEELLSHCHGLWNTYPGVLTGIRKSSTLLWDFLH